MERRKIQNFIDASKTKIAPQSNLCIHVSGKILNTLEVILISRMTQFCIPC